jgi:hypothetical protein
MHRIARLVLVVATVAALAAGAAGAIASDNRPRVLDANLAALPVALTGQTLFGVVAGGAPWRLDGGRATLFDDGSLRVDVRHLVLVPTGANPIPTAVAIVTCGGVPVATTAAVPYSTDGDASIDTRVDLPAAGCFGPAVFFAGVIPATGQPRWFAVTGSEG